MYIFWSEEKKISFIFEGITIKSRSKNFGKRAFRIKGIKKN